ncbi:multiple sugar transport system permease protein [Kineococcus radiotolerans]|uniref:Multiple sugar transport system permease protein n=1 Tax=Kineococcus radiotolerans TaxID=131568 RepID=A0A7W4TJ58_KINRA|nr:carbohydrate ABC transporter permease [Kineococcus radiotolerans]MBB2899291.1 multiple sugar transport system permease protein [Kineococcus radiotolerans]
MSSATNTTVNGTSSAPRRTANGAAGVPSRHGLASRLRTAFGVAVVAVLLFPVYWMVNTSLQGSENLLSTQWFPLHLDLDGYRQAIDSQLGNLGTSLVIASGAVVVCLAVSAPAAYGLSRTTVKLPGGGVVMTLLVITQMIPGIVIANGLFSLYNDLGLINSHLGLILADASLGVPFCILLMRSFMVNIPSSLVEAAKIDGASEFRVFRSIIVPLSRNSLVTAAVFAFLFAWSDFMFALTLTTGDTVVPVTLSMYTFVGAHTQSWAALMATATLASIPAAALLVLAQRYIAAGVTGGAVK